jgi:hypothetical protein
MKSKIKAKNNQQKEEKLENKFGSTILPSFLAAEQAFITRRQSLQRPFQRSSTRIHEFTPINHTHYVYNKATTAIEAPTNEATEAALILLGVGATGALAATGTVGAGHFNVASHETDPLAKVLVKL